jgi:succinate dehydrogenase / fumarate reductase membrane anchor subunit
MVSSGSKFSRSGLSDWLIQRASAVVLGLYVLVLGWVLLRSPALDFAEWSLLFDGLPMKILLVSLFWPCARILGLGCGR